jgi:hypothetical protein
MFCVVLNFPMSVANTSSLVLLHSIAIITFGDYDLRSSLHFFKPQRFNSKQNCCFIKQTVCSWVILISEEQGLRAFEESAEKE